MIRRYVAGETLKCVGMQLGYSPSTIRNYLRSAGIELRDTHGRER